jgi:translocation and assembly module TamB
MPRWIKILGILVLAFAAIVATLPWWLGLVLRPIARSRGVTFAQYETVGYTRFSLRDVRFEHPGVIVTAGRLQAPSPLFWLWQKDSGLTTEDWRVVAKPNPARNEQKSPPAVPGIPALHERIERIATLLARWAPNAILQRGEISWPGESLQLERVDLHQRQLTVKGLRWRDSLADVAAEVSESGNIGLSATEPAQNLRVKLDWLGAQASATGTWFAQPFSVQAQFPVDGWWPAEATIQAENWKLPAEKLKLGPGYATAVGGAHLHWQDRQFDVTANVRAESTSGSAAPPLTLQLEAHGDPEKVSVTKADVKAPFALATLSAPLTWSFDRKRPAGTARLNVEADLSKQTWTQRVGGKVQGVAEVDAASNIRFALEIDGAHVDRYPVRHAGIEGVLQWPRLEISRAKLNLDDVNHADFAGQVDFNAKTLEGVAVRGNLTSAWFSPMLPSKLDWKGAEITAQLSGPWTAPQHSGTIAASEVQFGRVKPVNLHASWSGAGFRIEHSSVKAITAGGAVLEAAGAFTAADAEIRELQLTGSAGEAWKLVAPARIAWSPALSIDHLQLRSADGQLDVALTGEPGSPVANLSASNIRSKLLADWIELAGPTWEVCTLTASTRMDSDVLAFDARMGGRVDLQPTPADVSLLIHGDRNGVKLDEARFVEGDRTAATATGRIPVTWRPTATKSLNVDGDAPLEFQAQLEPHASIWSSLPALVGVTLDQPSANVQLTGTLNQPRGELRATARRLAIPKDRFPTALPEIGELSLQAHAARDAFVVDSLSAQLDGQPVAANGRISLAGDKWRQLLDDPAAYLWQSAEGQLVVENFDLAPMARRFPTILAAQGKLSARVNLAAGSHLTGELRLQQAATRPLAPFGVFQDVNAEMALNDRTLDIRSWTAVLGGQPLTLSGKITLPRTGPVQLAVALKGENLPLVRRAGLLLRSDLDLHADTNARGSTLLSGTVNLRDCFVLADLAALVPTGPRTVAQQPPYFSVDIPPFNQWRLAIDLRGRRAIRVNTAVFKGYATPKFHLSGTLGEPRAVGDITVDEGRVLFPFATFTVQYASVRLSDADPFHPQLALNAQARYHDYQLRLEGSGPVETPTVTFSSIPALETAQVLMMVTSGQVPDTDTAGARTGSQRLTQLGTYLGQGLLQGASGDASRLEITAGERVSRQGKETYEFTYRLDDRWSLVGEYDEYDEYNAGVKWRAYTQEGDAKKRQ